MDADHNKPVGHVTDELPLLLVGEADRDTVRSVGAHLRACTDCRDDLVDAVISHATLQSASLHAPDVATGGRLAFASGDVPAMLDEVVSRTPEREPVDLGPVFAQIRAEAASAEHREVPAPVDELAARRGRRTRRALTAAAAVVVIGGGTAVTLTALNSDSGRSVTVAAFGSGTVNATAQVGDGWMKLDASSLQRLSSNQFYEAWLVSADASGVMALGPLGSDGKASFSVPSDVMAKYPTLQVTVQDVNGNPEPSGTSVLRASL